MTERKCIACVATVSRVWAEVSDTQGALREVLFFFTGQPLSLRL